MRGNGVARGEKDWFSPAPKPYRRPDDRYPLYLLAWSRTFASLTFERRSSRVAKLWLDFLNPDFRESGNQVTCPFIHVVLLHDVTEEPHSRLPFFQSGQALARFPQSGFQRVRQSGYLPIHTRCVASRCYGGASFALAVLPCPFPTPNVFLPPIAPCRMDSQLWRRVIPWPPR